MTGSASTMRSPSTLTSTRSTPWVAGCWGPTFSTISSVCSTPAPDRRALMGALVRSSGTVPISAGESSPQRTASLGLFLVLGPGPRLEPAAGEPERLAQGVALEVLGQVELDQVRVALEEDAEHLGALPLVPVGAPVDARERRHHRILRRQSHVCDDRGAIGEGVQAHEHLEPLRLPVDRREEGEVVAVELGVALEEADGGEQVAGRQGHVDGAEP